MQCPKEAFLMLNLEKDRVPAAVSGELTVFGVWKGELGRLHGEEEGRDDLADFNGLERENSAWKVNRWGLATWGREMADVACLGRELVCLGKENVSLGGEEIGLVAWERERADVTCLGRELVALRKGKKLNKSVEMSHICRGSKGALPPGGVRPVLSGRGVKGQRPCGGFQG
ncbi:hypothetical protein IEQ34_007844 [Dendrobium chrysotoxum]|uniref:Uncharacterized protein n=1 Tax=Dendrobium chrysotoxum TaxID=161865 RepID=A0AAV7H5W2_DENCH|nr:hypothetical protein IEQ34_007844 [Dendrobium chrysotoxum]